jgi:peptidoglycan/LPS O-acetylase OafA/YrhL
MPRPVSATAIYMPGLDGVRALAVIAVIGYHLKVPFMPGGLLGVGMFFTLSGFLITFILLRTWGDTGHLDLRTFWLRRARRLLPAVVLLLVVVLAATALVAPDDFADRFGESIAAMLYVSNWTTIASDNSYFEAFASPRPLDHLWSLAVEEQFYVVWPLLLLGLLNLAQRRLNRVALMTLTLTVASFVWMVIVADPGFDNTRAYEGTDTRAGGLLLGAVLAMVWRPDRLSSRITPGARAFIDGAGLVALVVLGWLVVRTDPFSLSLYRGGLLVLSIATAVLVAVVVHPASRLGAALGTAPFVWIGERSYGIYLWHLPVIAFTPDTIGPDDPVVVGAVQVMMSLVLAELSWKLVEDPIRTLGLRGALRERRDALSMFGVSESAPGGRPFPVLVGGTGVVAALGVAVLAMLPVTGGTARQSESSGSSNAVSTQDSEDVAPTVGDASTSTVEGDDAAVPVVDPAAAVGTATSCDRVVHIGDSTSRGLFNPDQLPDPGTRIDARYRAVGVTDVFDEVSPAQSVVETYGDDPNADTRVANYVADGYDGCWVFALGMQDSANQAVGGVVPLPDRIDRLMEQIGDSSALWMTGLALEQDGPWSDPEIQKWNEAVADACARWPNMRVYDWRSEARDEWYDQDGIHFNQSGDIERAQRIAAALAVAVPDTGAAPAGCLVTSEG